MRTRTLAVVGLALLATLSGCSALSGPAGDGGSGNGADLESVDYPDGAGPEGFTNASRVLATHQEQLAQDSYRLAFNLTYDRQGQTANTTTFVASNESQARQRLQADLPGRSLDRFTNAQFTASRHQLRGNTTYGSQRVSRSMGEIHYQGATPGQLLSTVVRAGNYTATGVETRDGRTIITYEANSVAANASGQLPETVGNLSATVTIDERGRIWEARLVTSGSSGGAEELFYQQYRTMAVGDVTVTRPAWVANATN